MHLKTVSRKLEKELNTAQEASLRMLSHSKKHSSYKISDRKRSRSISPQDRDTRKKEYSHHSKHRSRNKVHRLSDKGSASPREEHRSDDRHTPEMDKRLHTSERHSKNMPKTPDTQSPSKCRHEDKGKDSAG